MCSQALSIKAAAACVLAAATCVFQLGFTLPLSIPLSIRCVAQHTSGSMPAHTHTNMIFISRATCAAGASHLIDTLLSLALICLSNDSNMSSMLLLLLLLWTAEVWSTRLMSIPAFIHRAAGTDQTTVGG